MASLPEMETSTQRIALVEKPETPDKKSDDKKGTPPKEDPKKQSNSGLGTNEDS